MKQAIKKVAVCSLAAVMSVSMLAGCGGAKKSDSKKAEGKTTKADKKADNGNMTISVLGIDWGFGPKENSAMEQYWEKQLGVNLDIEWVNFEDYDQKVNTLISSDSMPDVVQISKEGNGSYYYPIFTQAIDAGSFVDLNKYLFNNGQGIAETNAVMKNWDQTFWDQAKYKDGIYIMPRSKAESGQFSGISVRKDLMKKYGFETEPTTMDELKDWIIGLSKAASDGEGKKIYGLDFYGENFMDNRVKAFATAFTGQSDWAVDANGDYQYMQFQDSYLDFLNWMKDLYDAKAIDPEFALSNEKTSSWKAGNSVAYLAQWYNWNQSADRTSNKIFDQNLDDSLEAWCLMPVKGPKAYTVSPNYTDIDSCIAISAKCSDEKIKKILDVFNKTEQSMPGYDSLLQNGVEGVHYEKLPDGTLKTTGKYEDPRREGYVGAWNQIFLKSDADEVTGSFKRDGANAASPEAQERAQQLKDFVNSNLKETGIQNEAQNLLSETYDKNWSKLTDDVNASCAQYVMGKLDEKGWKDFVKGIVNSDDYKTIQKEFKDSAAKQNK